MTDIERKLVLNEILGKLADKLDIPPSKYEDAKSRYEAVGNWLNEDDSLIAQYSPEIYPQGSFCLGTVIKPITDEDEYDIDLVCELQIPINEITQQQLKRKAGDRLKANETYRRMLDEEGRRCWRLNYAESTKFHMDILPAIPDEASKHYLRAMYDCLPFAQYAICITDKETWGTSPEWPRSNPKGYAEWFKQQMRTQFARQRKVVAEELRASVGDVPEYRVKTSLQRSIQILKRHRDIMFEDDSKEKPISIIITTLAAHAYKNEPNVLDALMTIVNRMPEHIQNRNGASWVSNPVDPRENFADKWDEFPEREEKFRQWLLHVRTDLDSALCDDDIHAIGDSLKAVFGVKAIHEVFASLGKSVTDTSAQKEELPRVTIQNPSKPWSSHEC